MRGRSEAVAIGAAFCVLCGCGEPAEEDAGRWAERDPAGRSHVTQADTSVQSEILALIAAQQAAWNRGDLDGFMRGYWESPDLVFTSGGQVQRGYDTVLERYRRNYGDRKQMGQLTFGDLEVHWVVPGAAWVLGRWELAREDGPIGGVFTLVLRRFEDGWKIVHDHTSQRP